MDAASASAIAYQDELREHPAGPAWGGYSRLRRVTGPADGELMLRYSKGDQTAFAALYQRYRGPLYRFIARQIDPSKVDDVYQEVWIKLISSRSRYRPKAKFSTYLYRIARNALIDEYRRRGRQPMLQAVDDETMAGPGALGPEEQASQSDLGTALLAAVAGLPEEQRSVFLLREEAGLALREISAIVGRGPETVKSQLRYARDKLRKVLAQFSDDGEAQT